jgi:hypothetical protein
MQPKPPSPSNGLRVVLFVLLGCAAILMLILAGTLVFFLNTRNSVPTLSAPKMVNPDDPDFSQTNSVTIDLGGDETSGGLILIDEPDGRTVSENVGGATARLARPREGRSETYVYFGIHPSFKQSDLRQVRFDVEFLDPQPGSLNVHYDADDAANARNAVYKGTGTISFRGSNEWRTATFRTRADGAFLNRQNGQADFRLSVRASELYLRRVTVTREPVVNPWPIDYSSSNEVTVLLGAEKLGDGLRHVDDVGDGRTVVTNVNGVPSRYLNRLNSRNPLGALYFEICPSFKAGGLSEALIEVEYLTPSNNAFRLQYDGEQNGRRSSYVSVLPIAWPNQPNRLRYLNRNAYMISPTNWVWSTATFQVANALFRNSQNGDSDFRLEVTPSEIYVRRVTVKRSTAR